MLLSPRLATSLAFALAISSSGRTNARDVPQNVQDFYYSLRKKGSSCSKQLATGFYATDNGPNTFSYCGDHLDDFDVIYIQGTNRALADMDIDCDGVQGGPGDDGRCSYGRSPDLQDVTAFQDVVAGYNAGIKDLNPYIHPYVVFGNSGNKTGWKTFDPTAYGVEPLSVIGVVCGNQLIYGIWGDTNGDDGDKPMVGEAAISLATACEGDSMTGDNGYSNTDILYLAFTGKDAVPGAKGANWSATDYATFEKSIEPLGNKLTERIGVSLTNASVNLAVVLATVALGSIWVAL
ncbi:fungal chitosanase of glycosyl hydrolase group 75-domain-containing protein [Podospora didyma]|uniref:Endo-chitosanase n=1 Tax=Podospora didyma TaxID=330526 RepID=A0AAE0P6K4_9PEZI|nr:fungal chitosanase of glycosyl hydrolase group 75-domain-containing protein [Podospora didyma]